MGLTEVAEDKDKDYNTLARRIVVVSVAQAQRRQLADDPV
jgi:hypothetical protein